MKELIVIIGATILGCYIFYIMVGDENSLKTKAQDTVEHNYSKILDSF